MTAAAPQQPGKDRPRRRPAPSLRRQVLAVLATVVLLVVFGGNAALLLLVRKTEQADWRGRQLEATRRVTEVVGTFIARQQDLLRVIDTLGRDELEAHHSGDPEAYRPEMAALLEHHPDLLEIVYIDPQGRVSGHAAIDTEVLANLFTTPQANWFVRARLGESYVGDVQLTLDAEQYLILSMPGAGGAVLAARLRMKILNQVIGGLHFGRSGIAYLVNQQGRVIAHSDRELVQSSIRVSPGSPLLVAARSGADPVAGAFLSFAGEPVVGTLLQVPGTRWVAVTELPQAEAYAGSRQAVAISAVGTLLFGAVLFIAGSALLERRLLRPIRHLRDGVQRIGEGELDQRLGVQGSDELDSLAAAFNRMALRLRERESELAQRSGALQASEARYRAIVEDQTELICRFAPDGRLTFVNDAYCRYFAKSRDELLGQTFQPLIPEEDHPRLEAHLAALGPHNPVACVEHRVLHPDGEIHWQHWTDRLILGTDGHVIECAAVGRDITESKRAEAELAYRSRLEGLLVTLAMRIINIHDAALDQGIDDALAAVGRFVGADRAYQFEYDFARGILISTRQWCAEGIAPEKESLQALPNALVSDWVEIHRRGEPMQVPDVLAMPPDHPLRNVLEPQGIQSLLAIPMCYGEECLGFVGFAAVRQPRTWTDTEIALLKVLTELLVNAEMRRRHEQRIGEARRQLEESSRRAGEMARAAAAASEAKSRFLATMSHEIRTPVHGVLGMLELLLDSGLDARQHYYAQVARESGEILLGIINDVLDVSKIEAGRLELEIVAFEPRVLAQRVMDLLRPQAQAKGLGLELRLLAQSHPALLGDALRIRQILINLVGNAIKFTAAGGVTLELATAPSPEGQPGCLLSLRVIDTGIGIRAEALPHLFQPFMQADSSTTRRYGGSGLGLAIVRQLTHLMGGKIGVETEPGRGSTFWVELPLVPPDPTQSEQVHSVLRPKPADDDRGQDDLTSPSAGAAKALVAPWAPDPGGRGPCVLVVDDNRVNQVLAECQLRSLGCQVWVADDGATALAAAAQTAFDLILMDCRMPAMDGLETTRRLRAREAGAAAPPVIAMTANALQSDRADCLAAGMSDFLAKPYTRAELTTVLGRWLPGWIPSGNEPWAADPASPPAPAPTSGGEDPKAPEVLERATLQGLIEGNNAGKALVTRLLHLFWENGGLQVAQIQEALEAGAWDTLIRAAHTLTSSSATLGAARLASISRQIELAARAGQYEGQGGGLAGLAEAARGAFDDARAAQERFLEEEAR